MKALTSLMRMAGEKGPLLLPLLDKAQNCRWYGYGGPTRLLYGS